MIEDIQWSDKTPTIEGWYWWRKRKPKAPIIVYVEFSDSAGVFVRRDIDECLSDSGCGEWYGPIMAPKD